MSYKDLGKVEYLPFAESVDLMKNRQLDATLQSAGLGVASLKDLCDLERDRRGVGAEGDRRQDRPALHLGDHSGQHLYRPGQGRADRGGVNYLVTSSAVSDDLAYQMTKLVFESLPELAERACGRQGDQAGDRRERQPGSAASRRDPLLQGKGPDQVTSARTCASWPDDDRGACASSSRGVPASAFWDAAIRLDGRDSLEP